MRCKDCRHMNRQKLRLAHAGYCLQKKTLRSYESEATNCRYFDPYAANAEKTEERHDRAR